jgi:hypothetical protein
MWIRHPHRQRKLRRKKKSVGSRPYSARRKPRRHVPSASFGSWKRSIVVVVLATLWAAMLLLPLVAYLLGWLE